MQSKTRAFTIPLRITYQGPFCSLNKSEHFQSYSTTNQSDKSILRSRLSSELYLLTPGINNADIRKTLLALSVDKILLCDK